MAEYIEKADLVKRLESRVKDYGRDCNSNAPIISRTYQAVLHMVENLPTADVVPVVRCKDCKHWKKYENTTGAGYCKKREFSFEYGNEHTFNPITMPDFYCSHGERRCEERETENKPSMD